MNAYARTPFVLLLSCGFAGLAAAATGSAPAGSTSAQDAASNPQGPAHLGQKLRDDLAKAGFTNITIMPSSFLVRAKDSEGNPVMMIINPDSLTEVTEHTIEHSDAPVSGAVKGQPNSPIPSPLPKPAAKP
jgi:hypothetical protein